MPRRRARLTPLFVHPDHMADSANFPPSLCEWLRGIEAIRDGLHRPVSSHMHPDHPDRVAYFIGEVLGGQIVEPDPPSRARNIYQHLNRNLAEPSCGPRMCRRLARAPAR